MKREFVRMRALPSPRDKFNKRTSFVSPFATFTNTLSPWVLLGNVIGLFKRPPEIVACNLQIVENRKSNA